MSLVSVKTFDGVFYRERKHKFKGVPDRSYDVCWAENGKKRWLTVGRASVGVTPEEAYMKRLEILTNLRNPATKKCDPTLAETVEHYLESHGSKHNRYTVSHYILPSLNGLRLSEVSVGKLSAMRDGMIARGLAPATIKNALSLLSAAFNLSSRHGLWDGPNPANAKTGVQYPKLDNNGERYLTPEEAKMLLAELEAQSSWWHNATLLALCTGVRRTEIYRMRADDLDAEAGVIMLRSKLGLREPLLLTPRAIMVLEDRIRSRPRPDGLVFGQKNSRAFRETVKKLGFNAGVTERRRRVWFHILRHTFASWLFMTGTDIYVVQRLMRHSSIAMTQRYAHLGADTQREGLKSIVSLLATKA